MNDERTPLRWILATLPVLVIVAYVWIIHRSYSDYFDWRLNYLNPAWASGPQDDQPLGFAIPWAVAALVFLVMLVAGLALVKQRLRYAGVMIVLFGLLTGLHYHLHQRLEMHLLCAPNPIC
jgi:hypothetical protein